MQPIARRLTSWFALPILLALPLRAADADGFVDLFNGRDLAGWVNANCAPETWSVRHGVILCSGKPTGALRTERQYENFILELEWRHLSSGGNSGVFIWGTPIASTGVPFLRGIEVQVLDHGFNIPGKNEWYTTHGDVFPIHGATMVPFGKHNGMRSFPSEERSKPSPQWNHYRITAHDGVLRLEVNGKEVSGGRDCSVRKGYLALESEGAPVEFRRVRIRELPTTGARPEATAPIDLGWRPLFTGLDLRGWNSPPAEGRWSVRGERLALAAGDPQPNASLWAEGTFARAEFILDARLNPPPAGQTPALPRIQIRGLDGTLLSVPLQGVESEKHHRYTIRIERDQLTAARDGEVYYRDVLTPAFALGRRFGLQDTGSATEFMNLYRRDL